MFTDLKPYPEYQDVEGVERSALPTHWDIRRLGQIGTFAKGRGGSREDDIESGVPCIRYGDLYKHYDMFIPSAHTFVSEGRSGSYSALLQGDILFALSGELITDIGKSAVSLIPGRATCGGDLAIFRATAQADPLFLGHSLGASDAVAQKSRAARGDIVVHISVSALQRLLVALPPREEQAAIAKYLGHANARVDRAIAVKRKLIALLEEQKQAVINQAVTRGLDPTVPLRDSGIPWTGQIPAHWDVIPTGAGSSLIQTGPFGSQLHADEYVDGGVPVINPSHISPSGIIAELAVSVHSDKADELSRHRLVEGDVIAARRGELGRCAVVESRESGWLCGTGSLIVRVRRDHLRPSYFQLVFSSQPAKEQLEAASIGATMANLNAQIVARLRIPIPPLDEQTRIVEHVASSRRVLAAATDRAKREIELLREFRTRLTADVVTGQLDVREIAAGLPDLGPADLVGDVGADAEDDLDSEAAELFEEMDA